MANKSNITPEKNDKNYFKMAKIPVSDSKVFEDNRQQCRICLQPIQHNEIPEICRCKGNSGVVHKKCLIEWVKKSPQEQINSQYFSMCEICKTPIFLQTQNFIKCINLNEFKLIKKQSYCTVAIFIFFFIGVIALVLSIYGYTKNEQNEQVRRNFLIGIILSSVILFMDLCGYLVHAFTKIQMRIVGFKNFKEASLKNLRKSQIIPILDLKNEIQNQSSVINLHDYPIQ